MSNQGLRGHETVIRLVGKRRKLTLSAISPKKPAPHEVKQESSQLKSIAYHEDAIKLHRTIGEASQLVTEQKSGTIQEVGVGAGTEKQVDYINWVQCPICAKSIRGDVINTHLDICLQGGAKDMKRKSKQLTMSQFGGSTCIGKLSSPNLQAGLLKLAAHENQKSFGSVKAEASAPFGSGKPTIYNSQGKDVQMDEKPNNGLVKLDRGPIGASRPMTLSPLGHDIRQSRMRLKRFTTEDAHEIKAVHPRKNEEPGQTLACGIADISLGESREKATVLEKSRQADIESKGQKVKKKEWSKNFRQGHSLEESPSYQISGCDCSCNCHFSTLIGDAKELPEENQVVGEKKLDFTGSVETIAGIVGTETDDSMNVHSTEKLINDRLIEVLDTKIVGRRFNRGTICKQGMKVTILREPDNPKDPNAIKVVQFEDPSGLTLGHLAREISLHLSRLLDRGLLQVWGSVTAVPEQPFGAVPIKLFCESKMPKEDFLKLNGAEDSLQNVKVAAHSPSTPQQSSSGTASRYQQNFSFMLQTVLERDSHLFKDEEKTFLETFSSVSDDAQRLFIRLYQRKGPWFRLSTIEYKDVADVIEASDELLAAGYMTAQDSPDEDPETALRKRFEILNVVELRQFVCTTLMKKKSEVAAAKREDLVNMAVSAGNQKHVNFFPVSPGQSGSTLSQLLAEITGRCIRVSDVADFLLWRLKRLFFLNGNTELSAFLVVDMGLVKYPRYKCWRAQKIFETHDALVAYEQALEVAQGMDMALECNDTQTALKLLETACQQMHFHDSNQPPAAGIPTFLARFSASYVYRNICTLGVSILERERRYFEAVDVLRQLLSSKTIKSGRWGYWTVRLSMDLDHLGRKEESLQVAEEGVNDSWIRGGDRVALQRRVVRLGKPPRRWKTPSYAAALKRNCKEVQIQGRPLSSIPGVRSWFYGYDGQQCRVEELALQYFASEEGGGWQGVHCEGGVWMTFFGLLMWDVLFADVPDVFQTPFQTAPLDLDTEVFFSSRQSLIEAQLAAIAEGDTGKLLARAWNQNMGTMCQGVNWERHSLEELETIASCIGGPGLSAVCRLLAEDHAGWTAGMPDLLLWRAPATDDSENLSQAITDSRLCANCGCNLLERTSTASRSQRTSTAECSSQAEQRTDSGGGGFNHSLDIPRSLTRRKCSKPGDAKLVEVKGPRDRLSEQQRAWIWILMNAGLSVEVCKVLEEPTE